MPHMIVEYSSNLTGLDTRRALHALNEAVLASGEVVDPLDLKSRAVRRDDFWVGAPDEEQVRHGFVHVTLLLLEGRTPEAKKRISQSLIAVLQGLEGYPAAVRVQFSVELRDMVRETYGKSFKAARA